uniref:Uncharacterized protein n=1 Tax=Moniliophthora roreri TaxID=221103 RepID=A0A0W0FMX4_MONRR
MLTRSIANDAAVTPYDGQATGSTYQYLFTLFTVAASSHLTSFSVGVGLALLVTFTALNEKLSWNYWLSLKQLMDLDQDVVIESTGEASDDQLNQDELLVIHQNLRFGTKGKKGDFLKKLKEYSLKLEDWKLQRPEAIKCSHNTRSLKAKQDLLDWAEETCRLYLARPMTPDPSDTEEEPQRVTNEDIVRCLNEMRLENQQLWKEVKAMANMQQLASTVCTDTIYCYLSPPASEPPSDEASMFYFTSMPLHHPAPSLPPSSQLSVTSFLQNAPLALAPPPPTMSSNTDSITPTDSHGGSNDLKSIKLVDETVLVFH